jgi:hypothetical protein
MDIDLPEELWRHILSYNTKSLCKSVCKSLYDIEKDLVEERVINIVTKYGGFLAVTIFCRNWDATSFILDNIDREEFDTSTLSVMDVSYLIQNGQYFLLKKLIYSLSHEDKVSIFDNAGDEHEYLIPIILPETVNLPDILRILDKDSFMRMCLLAMVINDLETLKQSLSQRNLPYTHARLLRSEAIRLGRTRIVEYLDTRSTSCCIC